MKVTTYPIPGLLLIEPKRFGDARGWFAEVWQDHRYREAGIAEIFVQDNMAMSQKGVLRGLHYQLHHPQAKLVSVIWGEIFDVAVDVRRSSPTFGQWVGCVLSAENRDALWVPPGFAHGFLALSDTVGLAYKCTDFYAPEHEHVIRWDDPDIGIEWPVENPIISEKDNQFQKLSCITAEKLPSF